MHAAKAALRRKQIVLRRSEDRRVLLGRKMAELLKDDFWRTRLFLLASDEIVTPARNMMKSDTKLVMTWTSMAFTEHFTQRLSTFTEEQQWQT